MPRTDVIEYLRGNLKKFPPADLRRQLAEEGVSDVEFDEALKAVLATPKPASSMGKAGVIFIALGAAMVVLAAFYVLSRPPPAPAAAPLKPPSLESAFIGHYNYVVKLPPNYMAQASYKDQAKTVEVVYFFKIGMDPTNFIDKGLYGQLGIVRLEAAPDPLAASTRGVKTLMRQVTDFLKRNKEKYRVKNMQVSSLKGFEITVETPFPRLETYFLGKRIRYSFLAGQDDEIYRDLVTSLRETQSEN